MSKFSHCARRILADMKLIDPSIQPLIIYVSIFSITLTILIIDNRTNMMVGRTDGFQNKLESENRLWIGRKKGRGFCMKLSKTVKFLFTTLEKKRSLS